MMASRRRASALRRFAPPVLAVLVLVIVWELLARADLSRTRIIPAPSEVLDALVRTRVSLLTAHIPTTLAEALIGLSIAFALGVLLAALLDFSAPLKRAVYPLLVISQTIPIVAIAPVLILLFGFGAEPKVAVVVLFCFFPVTVAMIDGLMATDPDLVALLRAMAASRWQIWRKVRLPSSLPSMFSGLRIAAAYSIGGAVIGEFITAQYGLGQYLRSAYNTGQVDQGFAAIVITAALSVGLVVVIGLIERLSLPWYFSLSRQGQWDEPGIY